LSINNRITFNCFIRDPKLITAMTVDMNITEAKNTEKSTR